MTCYRVSQVGLLILSLCRLWGGTAYPLDCNNEEGSYMHCTSIPLEKLLDRAIQHAELLYNLSEESCAIFEERFVPSRLRSQKYRTSCYNKEFTLAIPNSKPEVQKLSDKWLLHSVLLLAQSWIEPFLYLQSSLKHYDSVPAALLDKTKWLSDKLSSLEQGVVVLMRKVVDEGPLAADYQQTSAYLDIGPRTVESVLQDYMILDCFRKDAHKIETFLRLLKCRWTNTLSCYPSEAGLSVHGGPLLAS